MIDRVKKIWNDIINDRKRLLIVIGVIVIFIVLFIVLFNIRSDDLLAISDGSKIKSEYEDLNGTLSDDGKKYLDVSLNNNIIEYATVDELLDIFNNYGDAVIYFGYASCAYCRSAIQVLHDTAKNTKLKKIYYMDTEKGVDNRLIEVLDEKFLIDKNGVKTINEPLVLFVTQGVVVSYNIGTLFSQEDPYVALDAAQVSGLGLIYEYGIKDVLTSIELKGINPVEPSNDNS